MTRQLLKGGRYAQQKVETPARRISSNVRAYPTVQSSPTMRVFNVFEREPYLPSYAPSWLVCGNLKLDFEEVQWVHAEDGHHTRTNACERMVLNDVMRRLLMKLKIHYTHKGWVSKETWWRLVVHERSESLKSKALSSGAHALSFVIIGDYPYMDGSINPRQRRW